MQIFISSVYQDARVAGEERHLDIRRRLHRLGVGEEVKLWIAEYSAPGITGWRTIVDTCVRALHESDLMIVLLLRRWGSAIDVDGLGPAPVSYLEIELFQASLRRVPVIFFEAEDFDPDPQLAALVRLIKRLLPSSPWVRAPQAAMEEQIVELVRSVLAARALPPALTRLCDALSERRSFADVNREIASTRLSFLDGFTPADGSPLSLPRVDLLLNETSHLAGTGDGTYVDRLSRLWMALRELAKQRADALDGELAQRWIRLSELWTSSAAWLHLHGPLRLGVLATLHTRNQLRDGGYIETREFPFGAFGSEAYSVAKISDTRRWKQRRFEAARRLATKQIEIGEGSSGAFGIRASASMQLALLGRPWLAQAGLADYRRMYEARVRTGASDSEIGEALAELGYAEFGVGRLLRWKRRGALQRLREGVALLDADHPERRPGFVVRAKRKLAEALEASRLLEEAELQRQDIAAITERHGLPPE
jgi:hypothetical protein